MQKKTILIEVGCRLRAIRLENGFSQDTLARALGRRFSAVASWEDGDSELGASDLANLVRILGCDAHFLLIGNRPPRGRCETQSRPLTRFRRTMH
jgi:transcriptional regulator with XRE-family HTH domain